MFNKEGNVKGLKKKKKNANVKESKESGDSNNDSGEGKKTFNIQLSQEDEDKDNDNIYDINDEEEDEEDDYEYEDNTQNINEDNKQTVSSPQQQQQITSTSISTSSSTKPLTSSTTTTTSSSALPQHQLPPPVNTTCHFIYKKGSIISINEIPTHQFTKIKHPNLKKSIFTKVNFFKHFQSPKQPSQNNNSNNNNDPLTQAYRAFFDEHFIYFLKDIPVDKNDSSLRYIGNKYDLFSISNIYFDKLNESNKHLWKITLEFHNVANNSLMNKELIFHKENAEVFYASLNNYFTLLNIKVK